MQAQIYLALAGTSSHYYISARAGEHHLGLSVYKITGSRTVSPRASQDFVLFCLNTRWFSVVSACTTQIRDIFFTVPACITFCVMTRSSVRFPTSLEKKDLSATVYSTVLALRLFQCRLCALAFQNILPPPWLVHAVEFCSHILWAHGDFIQCLTRMSANCKGSEFVN